MKGGAGRRTKEQIQLKAAARSPRQQGGTIPTGQEGGQEQATQKAPQQHQQRHNRAGKSTGTGFPQCLTGVLVLLLH